MVWVTACWSLGHLELMVTVDLSTNPVLLPEYGKKEETEVRDTGLNVRDGKKSRPFLEAVVFMRTTLVDQIKNEHLENGSLPSKMLTVLQKRGKEGMAGIWREWQDQDLADCWGCEILLKSSLLYLREEWEHIWEELFSCSSLSLLPWPWVYCKVPESFNTVCEIVTSSVFSYTKSSLYVCKRECECVAWGHEGGKKSQTPKIKKQKSTPQPFERGRSRYDCLIQSYFTW